MTLTLRTPPRKRGAPWHLEAVYWVVRRANNTYYLGWDIWARRPNADQFVDRSEARRVARENKATAIRVTVWRRKVAR